MPDPAPSGAPKIRRMRLVHDGVYGVAKPKARILYRVFLLPGEGQSPRSPDNAQGLAETAEVNCGRQPVHRKPDAPRVLEAGFEEVHSEAINVLEKARADAWGQDESFERSRWRASPSWGSRRLKPPIDHGSRA